VHLAAGGAGEFVEAREVLVDRQGLAEPGLQGA
jgi:hypothetical protein